MVSRITGGVGRRSLDDEGELRNDRVEFASDDVGSSIDVSMERMGESCGEIMEARLELSIDDLMMSGDAPRIEART